MRRHFLAAAFVLTCSAIAWAAEESQPRVITRPMGGYAGQYLMLPGYHMLGQPNVQKQIELLPEQKAKLEAISKKYVEESQGAYRNVDWAKIRELPREEQQQKYREMQETYKKATEEAKKQIEAVLLPHQIEKLKQLESRQRASSMLAAPAVLEKLGLTEEQKEKIKQLREDQQKKMSELMQETMDKTMEVLTPEQRKQLEELGAKGWQGVYGRGGQEPGRSP